MGAANWPFLDELEIVLALNSPERQLLHVCFVASEYPHPVTGTSSGVGSAVQSVAYELVQAGHRATVVMFSREALAPYDDQGVQVYAVRPGQWHWYVHKLPGIGHRFSLPVRELENSWRVWRFIRHLHQKTPFDVVEVTETDGLFLSLNLDGTLPPVVARLHGDEYTFFKHLPGAVIPAAYRLSRRIQRVALRRAAQLISPSASHAAQIAQELGYHAEAIAVVPHALKPLWTHWRQEYALAVREPLILFVGRWQPLKGILDAIRCFGLIHKEYPEMRLAVIGSQHPTLRLEVITDLIDEWHLTDVVTLIGPQTHGQIANWFGRAQALLMPSYYETFGLVALEAMTLGLPVAAYRVGALPEVTANSPAGLLVQPGDFSALATVLIALLREPDRWHVLSQSAQNQAATYTAERNLALTLDVYYNVINTHTAKFHGASRDSP